MADRRFLPRRNEFLKGTIHCPNGTVLHAVIRDISPLGARLVLDGGCDVPDAFDLIIPARAVTARAQVRWREDLATGCQIGVIFAEQRRFLTRDHEAFVERLKAHVHAESRDDEPTLDPSCSSASEKIFTS